MHSERAFVGAARQRPFSLKNNILSNLDFGNRNTYRCRVENNVEIHLDFG